MSKRQHRATSKAAHDSVKEHKAAMYEKILDGLNVLKVGGTFQEIAKAAGIEDSQCWKRLSEMQRDGKIYPTQVTRPTSSGRQAMVWQTYELKSPKSNFTPTEDLKQWFSKYTTEPTPSLPYQPNLFSELE